MKECPNCGATYEIQEIKLPVHDKDSFPCFYCKESIISWDGTHMYCVKAIAGPTKEYSMKSNTCK